jgi:hypothetical protein
MKAQVARTVRIFVAAVFGLLIAALFVVTGINSRRTSIPAGDGAKLDHTSCQQCHQDAWREWEASMHARAWRDATVQASFGTFGFDRKCQSCHAAEPTLASPDAEPVLRVADVESGVNCLTCHQLPDGGVAARRTIANAPCRPTESPLFMSSASCGVCHVASQKDWSASSFASKRQECQTCHMPMLAGTGKGRSHAFLGGHDDATVRSGVRMEAARDSEQVVVRLANETTGHNFPGERHHRMLIVQIIERAADGEIVLSQQDTIKGVTPFRGEASADKIRAGQTVEVRFPVVKDAVLADVSLLYKLYPWYTDAESLLVSRAVVELDEK